MPDQITGVQIVPDAGSPPTTCTIQIGPNGFNGIPIASLFNRTNFDAEQLFGNIRLKRLIGNYGILWSSEFTAALNANGVRCTGGDFFNVGFSTNVDGSYTVAFGTQVGAAPNQTITVNPADLADDTHDLQMVVKNVGAFLRIAGFHDLTTPAPNGVYAGKTAVQAVQLWTFRY